MSHPQTLPWRPRTELLPRPPARFWEDVRRGLLSFLVHGLRPLTATTAVWAGPHPGGQCIYFANHSSHLDTAAILSTLPARRRRRTRPVAAADYWTRNRLRRALAVRLFRSVLVVRREGRGAAALEPLLQALDEGSSLLFFPEGGRGDSPEASPFHAGLYELSVRRPDVPCVPVYVSDLWRVLPKGAFLPVPISGRVVFGPPIGLSATETKEEFLERAFRELRRLREVPR